MASAKYDYVIVGGGSAGSAIANRLSADPTTQVLVLEAGIADHRWDPIITMPAALGFPVGNRRYDWCYATEPEPHMQNRRMRQPRGKILGGSSSINGMMYRRGHPADFDQWAAETGEPGWDYAHVLPYFQRHEHVLTDDPEGIRGHAGPQILEPAEAQGPALRRVLRRGQPGRSPGRHQHQRPHPGGGRPGRAHDPPRTAALGVARLPRADPRARQPRGALRGPGRPGDSWRAPARSASSFRRVRR